MDGKDNGREPVYPCSATTHQYCGLTKRELFALHAEQPGVQEIVTAAGYYTEDNFLIYKTRHKVGADRIGPFNEWWATLTNQERFALTAKVKIQQADALLAGLSKEQNDGR